MLSDFLASAIEIASQAGTLLVEMMNSAQVREKGEKDLVTDADLAAQALIHSYITQKYPDHAWIGEEDQTTVEPIEGQYCWLVDPLDGTINYAHRFPNFAVSIALVRNGIPEIGVVYDPCSKELFSAAIGMGAYLNGIPIRPSKTTNMNQAMVAASFPPNVRKNSKEVLQFLEVLEKCQSVRRLGSAALNLCYVACGRMDGYWSGKVKPWDVAAGAIICQEAMATLTNIQGEEFDVWKSNLLVASSTDLHQELLICLQASANGAQ